MKKHPPNQPTRDGLARGLDVLRGVVELLGPNGERWDQKSVIMCKYPHGEVVRTAGPWCLFTAVEVAYWRLDGSQRERAIAIGRQWWGNNGSSVNEAHRALRRFTEPLGGYYATEGRGWPTVAFVLNEAIEAEEDEELTTGPFAELGPLW